MKFMGLFWFKVWKKEESFCFLGGIYICCNYDNFSGCFFFIYEVIEVGFGEIGYRLGEFCWGKGWIKM